MLNACNKLFDSFKKINHISTFVSSFERKGKHAQATKRKKDVIKYQF